MAYTGLTEKQIEMIRERNRAQRKEQGLPEVIENPVTLAKVARLLAGGNAGRSHARSTSGAADGAGPANSKDVA